MVRRAGGEWQVPVGEGTGRRVGNPCAPGFVIVPRYDPAAETALTRLSETEAFFMLALHAVNLLPHGASGTEALGRLAADCECYTLDAVRPRRGVRAGARPRGRPGIATGGCRGSGRVRESGAPLATGGAGMQAEWPEAGSVPVRREGASAVELDENIAVYDDVGQLLILLNSSAGSVWKLCDGSTTVDEIVEALGETYPDQASVIGDDVRETLRKLADMGLVSEGPAAPAAPRPGRPVPGRRRVAGAAGPLSRMGRAHRPPAAPTPAPTMWRPPSAATAR